MTKKRSGTFLILVERLKGTKEDSGSTEWRSSLADSSRVDVSRKSERRGVGGLATVFGTETAFYKKEVGKESGLALSLGGVGARSLLKT